MTDGDATAAHRPPAPGGTVRRPGAHLWPSPLIGVNYWSREGGPFMWRRYPRKVVRDELETLRDAGVALTRSFLFWPDFQPCPDVLDRAMLDAFARFLDDSDEIGLPTIPTFLVGHMSGEDWDVAWRGGRDLYSDPGMLAQQAFYIRGVVERFHDHPAVVGWLISNEFANYAGDAPPEDVRRWAQVCVGAVREGGSDLPVSLGDGAWTPEITGAPGGFLLRDQLDLVDFVGPHSYPMDDDQVRVHLAAAFVCEMAHFGKPVVLEEFGVPDALSSDEAACALYRQAFHLSLLAGATGWIPWNNTDFEQWDQDPYRHHPFELGFGLVRADGTPKPQLGELTRFRRLLDRIDVAATTREPTATSILVPSYLDSHPRVPAAERTAVAAITKHAYIAAKRVGLAPALQRELDRPQRTRLVIVPSNKLLTAPTFRLLDDWAAEGSLVFLAWFSGVSGSHRGAWWPDVAGLTGIPHRLRYGMREDIDDVVTWRFDQALGDIPAGGVLTFPFAGTVEARHMLPLDEGGAPRGGVSVLARDGQGRPALVRRQHGAGSVVVSTYAIEYFAAARPHAHRDDDVTRLYRALAIEAGAVPDVRVDDPRIVVDGLRHADGRRFVWLVNVTEEVVHARPVAQGCVLRDIETGDEADMVIVGPYEVRVLERRTIS